MIYKLIISFLLFIFINMFTFPINAEEMITSQPTRYNVVNKPTRFYIDHTVTEYGDDCLFAGISTGFHIIFKNINCLKNINPKIKTFGTGYGIVFVWQFDPKIQKPK